MEFLDTHIIQLYVIKHMIKSKHSLQWPPRKAYFQMALKSKWPLKPLPTTCVRSCTLSCMGDNLWSAEPLPKLSSAPANNDLRPRVWSSHHQPRPANKVPPPGPHNYVCGAIMFTGCTCGKNANGVERRREADAGDCASWALIQVLFWRTSMDVNTHYIQTTECAARAFLHWQ